MAFVQGSCSGVLCSGLLVWWLYFLCVYSLSHVWLFTISWTVAFQAPLSMGFPRQESWSGLPFPSPGDLPDQGIRHLHLQVDSLPQSHLRSPFWWLGLLYLWDFVTSCGVAGSVGVRFPFCSSPCYHPAPALACFSKLLLTLVGESETCCWLPPTSLCTTNCLTFIHNTAM